MKKSEQDTDQSGDATSIKLSQGTDINREDITGQTPLMHAAECGNARIVGFLLDQGAAIDQQSTALILAARKGYWDIARKLLSRGATIPTYTTSFFSLRYEHIVYLMGNAGFLVTRPNDYLTNQELATLRVMKEALNEKGDLLQLDTNTGEHVASENSPQKSWCTLQ
jgi:hypothetical protein